MEDKIISILKKKKPIPERTLQVIEKVGVDTGSSVFGGYIEGKSDIDILIPPDSLSYDELIVEGYGIYTNEDYDEDGYMSMYVKTEEDIILNLLICLDDEAFDIRVKVTKILERLYKFELGYLLEFKGNRCLLFETLIEILKKGK